MSSALLIKIDRIKRDPALQPGARGARKLAVTQVYDRTEIPASETCWEPPGPDDPCPVLPLPAAEMAVFNEEAVQQRHTHQQGTEIYIVVEGNMVLEVDGTDHHLQTGDAFIIAPGVPHEVKKQGLKFTSYVIGANSGGPDDKHPA